jgi:hypothetical protein
MFFIFIVFRQDAKRVMGSLLKKGALGIRGDVVA